MKKKISVIGLGYIGMPMTISLASKGYNVLGIEKNNNHGNKIINYLKGNNLNIKSSDTDLKKKFIKFKKNIELSNNIKDIRNTKIVLISVGFDFSKKNFFSNLKNITKEIGQHVSAKSLIIYECTLPPGTSERIIYPILKKELKKRNIKEKEIFFGYSFERIMPGGSYFSSIRNNFRTYSGINNQSKKALRIFLESFINTKKFPLFEFNKIEECETCKIIENSYRALNISYIDEWMKFCSIRKLNLNAILDAIRLRPSHNNIMRTGIGVGGYCLTKDGSFAKLSNKLFDSKNINFKLTKLSMKINKKMVMNSFNFINNKYKQNIKTKKILLLGTTYKEDVGDFRFSPSIMLYDFLKKKKYKAFTYDPYESKNSKLNKNYLNKFDIIIFCIKHKQFLKLNFKSLFKSNKYIFDLNHVIPKKILKNKFYKNVFILGNYS